MTLTKDLTKLYEELQAEKRLVEKTMMKAKSPLRYLELKAIYECLRKTNNKIDDILEKQ